MTRPERLYHPEYVESLPPHILGAHINDAFESRKSANGRCRHAVLSRSCFGDYPLLAHSPRQQNLAQRIVYLVRAGVIEVLALQVYLRSAQCWLRREANVSAVGRPT
jgi:hypothetical protein